jgi:small subunit ribosomal protein S20
LANIKSQIKRNRQNDKRRLRNRVYRGEARIAVKNARGAFDENAPESKEALLSAISALDKAAEKGVLHKNNVARRKSRLMKAFSTVKPVEARVEEPQTEAPVEAVAEPKKKAAPRKTAAAAPKAAKKAKAAKAEEPKAAKKAKAAKAEEPKAEKAKAKSTATRKKAPAKK